MVLAGHAGRAPLVPGRVRQQCVLRDEIGASEMQAVAALKFSNDL